MRPCPDQCKVCPFRPTSAPGWLGSYRPGEVFSSLWKGVPFFCHNRTNYNREDWLERALRNGRLCLGGLVAANRWGFPPARDNAQVQAAREAAAAYDAAHPGAVVIFERPNEFLEHHKDQAYLDDPTLTRARR